MRSLSGDHQGWSVVLVGFDAFGSEQGFHVHFDAFFWPLGRDVSIGVANTVLAFVVASDAETLLSRSQNVVA